MSLQQVLVRHAEAVATVRAFAARARAERVVLLLDAGGATVMLECELGGEVELTEGAATWRIPSDAPAPAPARPLPEIRPAPASALAIDARSGELEAPLGAIANLAGSVLALARAFGGGLTVATADFPTRDPGQPITIAAREGEPIVFAAGDRRFVLPDGAL
jgi:hypothetical protein